MRNLLPANLTAPLIVIGNHLKNHGLYTTAVHLANATANEHRTKLLKDSNTLYKTQLDEKDQIITALMEEAHAAALALAEDAEEFRKSREYIRRVSLKQDLATCLTSATPESITAMPEKEVIEHLNAAAAVGKASGAFLRALAESNHPHSPALANALHHLNNTTAKINHWAPRANHHN